MAHDIKPQLIQALRQWVAQRPGLEFGNYGDAAAYRAEMRGITRDLNHARQLLRQVELSHGITGRDMLRTAAHSRLTIRNADSGVTVDYITGQYFPTEYRRAACAVLASAIWAYWRDECGDAYNTGDKLRAKARREFGRGIASRWFR